MLALERSLNEGLRPDWGSQLRAVQEAEREKFKLTVHTQMLHIRYTLLQDAGDDAVYIETVRALRRELGGYTETINEVMDEVRCFTRDYGE